MDARDWTQEHASKIRSADEAIRSIPRGVRIFLGSGAAEPSRLVEALVRQAEHFADNEIVHLLTLGPAPYVEPGLEGRFRHTAFFIGSNVRRAVQEGRADFMPVFLSEIPALITSRRVRIDAALIQVTPPDRHGYVSLGVSVDIVRAAVDSGCTILAEVNPHMPRTLGQSFLHIDQIESLVPVDTPIPEIAAEPLDDAAREIGRNVASLIPDGATLQMGIGKIPDAVLAGLENHHDLGVHTEMFSDRVMRLAQAGVINGRKKTLLPGKIVTSFIMGSDALYRWVDDNPIVEMRPSSFTNDPFTIARNDSMVAINSAIAVDLTGQVAADTLMGRFFSGIGGQVDFIRGAARSRGGRPVIALRSTAKGGEVSRIQPVLEEGAGVVTSRGDVHFVVTEFGTANLWGKNIRQRTMELVEIAHPDFRQELLAAAKRRHYVFPDQIAPRGSYPFEQERVETLPDGREVLVRPVRLTDEEHLRDMFYRLSDESVYKRFLAFRRAHPHEDMQKLVDLDYDLSMALLVVTREDGHEETIAMARYDANPATRLCDIAFVVRDDWQSRGVATLLLRCLTQVARQRGWAGFVADVLASNQAMLRVFHKSGLPLASELEGGVYRLKAVFPAGASTSPGLET